MTPKMLIGKKFNPYSYITKRRRTSREARDASKSVNWCNLCASEGKKKREISKRYAVIRQHFHVKLLQQLIPRKAYDTVSRICCTSVSCMLFRYPYKLALQIVSITASCMPIFVSLSLVNIQIHVAPLSLYAELYKLFSISGV